MEARELVDVVMGEQSMEVVTRTQERFSDGIGVGVHMNIIETV